MDCKKTYWLPNSREAARLTAMSVCIIIAAFCGYAAMEYLQISESKLINSRYDFIVKHGMRKLVDGFNSRLLGMVTYSKLASFYQPNEEAWPNVVIPGYYDTAPELRELAGLDNIGFLPIVRPEQLENFERFMEGYYESEPSIPAGAGQHHFGEGVFSIDPNHPNVTYHDTTGIPTLYNSTNNILVPILQLLYSKDTTEEMFSYNAHSYPKYGSALDKIIDDCSPKYPYEEAVRRCGWISDSLPLPRPTAEDPQPVVDNFRSVILQPIYLNRNTSQLVGFVGGGVNWQIMLNSSFAEYGNLDCVVSDGTLSFTYRIDADDIRLLGVGDYHDPLCDSYRRTVHMAANTAPESGSVPYIVHLYPTHRFLEVDRTATPVLVGCCLTLIIILVAAIILMNDVLQIKELTRQNKVVELEHKRCFVRFISHEIRTPLNSVHLGLKLLISELNGLVTQLQDNFASSSTTKALHHEDATTSPLDSTDIWTSTHDMLLSWQELAADLLANSDSAVDVLNDLLNYDKIEMGTLRLEFSAVAIYPLVEKCTKAFQMQAKQKSVKLKLSGALWDTDHMELSSGEKDSYSNMVVIGDHGRLAQILRNLLSNALKFTPTGGSIECQVVTTTGETKATAQAMLPPADSAELQNLSSVGSVQISVIDSGVGLSPEQLSQICSEGVQFNANQLQAGQGSGLGLFISKGLATQHGGNLIVASGGLGQGSKFTLELPLWKQPAHLADHAASAEATCSLSLKHTRRAHSGSEVIGPPRNVLPSSEVSRRVLVVDDAETNRKMLIRLLKARGYVCEQAEDGQRGIELYQALCERREAVDVIVMDYEMPVMNGPTATKKLREMGCTCLIVGVTGNLLPEDVNYFKSQGANAVLGKPLNMQIFEDVMKSMSTAAAPSATYEIGSFPSEPIVLEVLPPLGEVVYAE